ncbi:protein WVD2-like 7 isoform X1 [Quercus robur]|uniref:protein WVD2-like 7 isoform X1 n=1 Tax=Quercus robur TaxID=38942 RepID=UPI0021631C72|nr:protein WVD2-like 7 isoform X1 [Quercus robur]
MGDSACLMQPFSYTAGIPNEANEGNPVHALGQSISFGRFMSESLAWEKWSSFSHNRYVEEAERYARPGSVAQKKAFFEAHYKKIAAQKAAALLEQANAASNNAPKPAEEDFVNNVSTDDSQTTSSKSDEVVNQQHDVKAPHSGAYSIVNDNKYSSNAEIDKFERNIVDVAAPEPKNQAFVKNSFEVEQSNHLDDADNHTVTETELGGTPQMEKPLLKSSKSNQDSLASMSKKKPSLSSSKPLIHNRASKLPSSPAKHTVPIFPKKDYNATPMNQKPATDCTDRKRSTPKSIHKSVNFTPIRELNRFTSTVMRKIESSRVGASSSKASKDCSTPLRTPTMVSKNDIEKQSSATPWSEKRRARTPIHPSASGSKSVGQRWRLLPSDCSKYLSACRNKMQSPNLSTPFSFRTEERAERRKKKLEEKFNANEAQKVQLQTTLKEKAETEIRKLRQTLCFKARPLPNFYKERKEPKDEIKKVPATHPQSPMLGRKPTRIIVERPSIKRSGSKHVQGKDSQTPTHSLTSQFVVDNPENTSPNIQMDSQNYKYYK